MENLFTIKRASEWLSDYKSSPSSRPLYAGLWHEGEFVCLMDKARKGKTAFALRIADSIAAAGHDVLFIDFCSTTRRFVAASGDKDYAFGLRRIGVNRRLLEEASPDALLEHLEAAIAASGIRTVVLDSLTWLCNYYRKADCARFFAQKLSAMRHRLGISLLIVADPVKRIDPYLDNIFPVAEEEAPQAPEEAEESAGPSESAVPDSSPGMACEPCPPAAPRARASSRPRRKRHRR